MIIINIKEIQEDFTRRYGGNTDSLKTFAVCSDLTVLGNGFWESCEKYFSLPLSIRTYITLRITDDDIFSLRFSYSDTEYVCSKKELSSYKENTLERDIFHMISHIGKKICGAQILFNYDVESEPFMNPLTALYCAFGLISDGKVPPCEEFGYIIDQKKQTGNIPCHLYGRKNYLISSGDPYEYIPFNMSGKKIVLVSASLKKENISKKLSLYLEKSASCNDFDNIYKKYVTDEINRRENIRNLLMKDKGLSNEVVGELKKSSYEYCSVLNKNSHTLNKMLQIAEKTNFCDAVLAAPEYHAVAAIVREENVDTFIDAFSKLSEKALPSAIKYYITETENSGVEILN